MSDPGHDDFTRIIRRFNDGDESASSALLDLVYARLRELAQRQMQREAGGHTLQPTALVHEAWLRLVGSPTPGIETRQRFFGAAAEAMRRVLVDHARGRMAQKRRADGERVTLAEIVEGETPDYDLLDLDEALHALAAEDERSARIVEMRYFVGLSVAECAELLEISEPTVKRDFAFARAWLHERLHG